MVVNAEAFDILSADINDKIDIGAEFLRGCVMRNRFHNAAVNAECFPDDILAVAGDSRTAERDIGIFFVDFREIFADDRNRIAVIRRFVVQIQ